MSSIQIIIVNFRTANLVIACLHSLEREVLERGDVTVSVVENDSGDDSAEKISQAIDTNPGWSSWVKLLVSPINGGFSYGNNFAIRPALLDTSAPQYFWLLNPDTVVHYGTVGALVDFMQTHPEVGICGGGLDDIDGTPWPYAFKFPGLLSELERAFQFGPVTFLLSKWVVSRKMHDRPARVDWICGANMMIRSEVIASIGLMDEEYFLYFEETDYCLQASRNGWQCWYLPNARVIHIAGQSTGVTGKEKNHRRIPGYWFESRRRYFVKNHGRLYAILTDVTWILAFISGKIRRWIQRKPYTDRPFLLSDFWKHSALLKSNTDGNVLPAKNAS